MMAVEREKTMYSLCIESLASVTAPQAHLKICMLNQTKATVTTIAEQENIITEAASKS